MSLRRFFVDPQQVGEKSIELSAELARHAGRVLRLTIGSEILLLDGLGGHYRCRISELGPSAGLVEIVERWQEPEATLSLRLIQALPKGDKMDLILQKGTELGIACFSPVCSERSVPVPAAARQEKKAQRWQKIVAEAARQSCRPRLPLCEPVADIAETLKGCQQELKLMLWEEGSLPLADALPTRPPQNVALLVGPEGGFSTQEADQARAAGFQPVSLGRRILRTETAGFAVAAILQYLYGDFGVAPRS